MKTITFKATNNIPIMLSDLKQHWIRLEPHLWSTSEIIRTCIFHEWARLSKEERTDLLLFEKEIFDE